MDKKNFIDLFAPFDRVGDTPRYRELRQAARSHFASIPLPTPRTEDWRFTNVAPIFDTQFQLSPMDVAFVSDDYQIGPFSENMTRRDSLILGPSDAIIDGVPVGQIADNRDSVFTSLNSSFLDWVSYVVVPAGKTVHRPIHIMHFSGDPSRATATNPRTIIVLGKNSKATVVEKYVQRVGSGTYFTNAVTEISLAENAVLDHVKVQDESTTAYHIANTQVVMAAKSNFTTHFLSLGGALVRNEVRVRFDGEHAEATVNGLYLANGTQHIDNFTVIDHAKPNCASHELYKGILGDRAHGVFNGKILVRKDAQKTDAKQTNKVLLLSDDATINTKPQLEIFADDVKCTHGATIGQLDATQLFYLQSRGIPLDAARRLLTFAFANDVVRRLKIEALREELEKHIV
jgi:Fe-S cluster assembly protein SufD